MKNTGFKILLSVFLLFSALGRANADEGMWLWMSLNKNYNEMREKGLKLTPDDIYNINHASLKDAVVSLRFCTAEFVSPDGLMFTNHHCAYSAIQEHSSPDHDYLTDGFWAGNRNEELPASGVTASILIRMEDVSNRVLADVNEEMSPVERAKSVQAKMKEIMAEAEEGNDYRTEVKSMLAGNQYLLFVYETYEDVRLVGAPPSSIGKFGGDADNWEWPRHTGDFSVLRVYTAPDGSPAAYSEENIPYKPRKYFPVSLKGVKEGDFSMVMGFPGRTQRYLSSYGIELAQKVSNPARIKARTRILDIIKESMNSSDDLRIKYAARYSQISNYWKYFIGQNEGLERLQVIDGKKAGEKAFQDWADASPERKERYGHLLENMAEVYKTLAGFDLYVQYLNEAVFAPKPMILAYRAKRLDALLKDEDMGEDRMKEAIEKMRGQAESVYEDYDRETERRLLAAGMELFYEGVPHDQISPEIHALHKKFKGDWDKYASYVFRKSFFDSKDEFMAFLDNPGSKKLEKDPFFRIVNYTLDPYFEQIMPKRRAAQSELAELQRLYIEGLMKMYPDKNFYPDANSTPRLTYGNVKGYRPRDAVDYDYFTTMKGIMEKEDPSDPEFVVSPVLKKLYKEKNFGPYAKNGSMHVAFISNNDITGGNSGSPVINGNGELIGIAFDGNWEAMTGDLVFDEQYKRCINVDIRYVLFVIDKFAGAGHIIDELSLVN